MSEVGADTMEEFMEPPRERVLGLKQDGGASPLSWLHTTPHTLQ